MTSDCSSFFPGLFILTTFVATTGFFTQFFRTRWVDAWFMATPRPTAWHAREGQDTRCLHLRCAGLVRFCGCHAPPNSFLHYHHSSPEHALRCILPARFHTQRHSYILQPTYSAQVLFLPSVPIHALPRCMRAGGAGQVRCRTNPPLVQLRLTHCVYFSSCVVVLGSRHCLLLPPYLPTYHAYLTALFTIEFIMRARARGDAAAFCLCWLLTFAFLYGVDARTYACVSARRRPLQRLAYTRTFTVYAAHLPPMLCKRPGPTPPGFPNSTAGFAFAGITLPFAFCFIGCALFLTLRYALPILHTLARVPARTFCAALLAYASRYATAPITAATPTLTLRCCAGLGVPASKHFTITMQLLTPTTTIPTTHWDGTTYNDVSAFPHLLPHLPPLLPPPAVLLVPFGLLGMVGFGCCCYRLRHFLCAWRCNAATYALLLSRMPSYFY